MILEVANLNIRPGDSANFERAFAEARAIIAALPVSTNMQRINESTDTHSASAKGTSP